MNELNVKGEKSRSKLMTHAMKEIYFVFHRANTHKSRFLTLDVLMRIELVLIFI